MKEMDYFEYLFQGITLRDKDVLEIGAGSGAISELLVKHGASKVVALEPEAAGSDYKGVSFRRLKNRANKYENINALNQAFQDFVIKDQFDLVVLHNSINHLNENLVTRIHNDKVAWDRYQNLIDKIFEVTAQQGKVVVCDSARSTFWTPFDISPVSNIEWEKHQNPDLWVSIFRESGFEYIQKDWTPVFGNPIIQLVTGTYLGAFLRAGHFRLLFQR
ncbi:methyltransferase domain-containing protein [Haloarcula amylovorans]|uniref:methyltransferase domain-containing protein n=1 Tax=Haloarcula amylovorans TaxID=2562280 RepID=UPI001430C346